MLLFAAITLISVSGFVDRPYHEVDEVSGNRLIIDANSTCAVVSEDAFNALPSAGYSKIESFSDDFGVRSSVFAQSMEWLSTPFVFPGHLDLVVAAPAKMKLEDISGKENHFLVSENEAFFVLRYEPLEGRELLGEGPVRISCQEMKADAVEVVPLAEKRRK